MNDRFSSIVEMLNLLSSIDWRILLVWIRFFSPLGMVPVVSLVGLGLLDKGFPVVWWNISQKHKKLFLYIFVAQICIWFLRRLTEHKIFSGWTVCWNRCSYVHLVCCLLSGTGFCCSFDLSDSPFFTRLSFPSLPVITSIKHHM